MTTYTPGQARKDAVQANLAMAKATKTEQTSRKADYYEGMADAYVQVYASLAGITQDQAQDDVFSDLEAAEA